MLGTVTLGPLFNWYTASAPTPASASTAKRMIQTTLRRVDLCAACRGGCTVGW